MGVRRTALVLASVVLGLGSMLAALPWATAAQAATAPAVTSATTILDVPTVGGVIHFGRTTAGDPGVVGVTASGPGVRAVVYSEYTDIRPASGGQFQPGVTYTSLAVGFDRPPPAGTPVFSLSPGMGSVFCYTYASGAKLVVTEAVYGMSGLIRFAAHLAATCIRPATVVSSELRLNSPSPVDAAWINGHDTTTVLPGTSGSTSFTLTNGGSTGLELGAVTVGAVPAGWAVTAALSGCPTVLAPLAYCAVHVDYTAGSGPVNVPITVATPNGPTPSLSTLFYKLEPYPNPTLSTRAAFDGVGLDWDTGGTFPAAQGFNVYRRLAGGAWTALSSTTSLTSTDLTLAAGQTADYQIRIPAAAPNPEVDSNIVTGTRLALDPGGATSASSGVYATPSGTVLLDFAGVTGNGTSLSVEETGIRGLANGPGTYAVPRQVQVLISQGATCLDPQGTLTVRAATLKASGAPYLLDAGLDLVCQDGSPLRIELRVGMTGQPSPVVVTSFAAPTVDPVFVGRSTTAQLTLANRGSTTETLGAASLSQPTGSNNPWHLVDGCAGTLAPGASCAITATFTPTVDWSGTALLRIPAASLLGQLEVPLVEHGVLDVTAPNVALPPVAALTTSSTATYASVATDSQSGVHDLDFRYRYARDSSATLSDWIYPTSWQAQQSVSFTRSPGIEYCVSARARDNVSNVSTWTADSCTSRIIDDRSLALSTAGWTRSGALNTRYYNGTYARTTTSGARLTGPTVYARRVAVLATTCSTCGTADVYVGAYRIGSINLYSAGPHYQVLLSLPVQTTLRSGAVAIRTTSPAGRLVIIDGFGISLT